MPEIYLLFHSEYGMYNIDFLTSMPLVCICQRVRDVSWSINPMNRMEHRGSIMHSTQSTRVLIPNGLS